MLFTRFAASRLSCSLEQLPHAILFLTLPPTKYSNGTTVFAWLYIFMCFCVCIVHMFWCSCPTAFPFDQSAFACGDSATAPTTTTHTHSQAHMHTYIYTPTRLHSTRIYAFNSIIVSFILTFTQNFQNFLYF